MPENSSFTEGSHVGRLKEWLLSHLTYLIFTLITVFFLIFSPNYSRRRLPEPKVIRVSVSVRGSCQCQLDNEHD